MTDRRPPTKADIDTLFRELRAGIPAGVTKYLVSDLARVTGIIGTPRLACLVIISDTAYDDAYRAEMLLAASTGTEPAESFRTTSQVVVEDDDTPSRN